MAKFTAQAGIDPLLRVDLDPGDEVAAERGSMVMMDAGLILKGKTRGGFFKSLARKFLNDETFFQQWIAAEDQAGTAYLAPSLPGGVKVLDVKDDGVMIADGCFLAATAGIDISAKAQGLGRAILSDSGGFFIMKAEGAGTLAVSGFGSLEEVEVTPDRPLLIDNGHLVAWDASLDYESLDHPPAVKRSTAVFDSGTEGCLRQPQATSGNPRSSASRINSLPPKAAGGFMPRST